MSSTGKRNFLIRSLLLSSKQQQQVPSASNVAQFQTPYHWLLGEYLIGLAEGSSVFIGPPRDGPRDDNRCLPSQTIGTTPRPCSSTSGAIGETTLNEPSVAHQATRPATNIDRLAHNKPQVFTQQHKELNVCPPEVIDLSLSTKLQSDSRKPPQTGVKEELGSNLMKTAADEKCCSEFKASNDQKQRTNNKTTKAKINSSSDNDNNDQDDKIRRTRTMFSEWQLGELEWRFSRNKYLITSDRHRIAKLLGLDQLQVKTWFQVSLPDQLVAGLLRHERHLVCRSGSGCGGCELKIWGPLLFHLNL